MIRIHVVLLMLVCLDQTSHINSLDLDIDAINDLLNEALGVDLNAILLDLFDFTCNDPADAAVVVGLTDMDNGVINILPILDSVLQITGNSPNCQLTTGNTAITKCIFDKMIVFVNAITDDVYEASQRAQKLFEAIRELLTTLVTNLQEILKQLLLNLAPCAPSNYCLKDYQSAQDLLKKFAEFVGKIKMDSCQDFS